MISTHVVATKPLRTTALSGLKFCFEVGSSDPSDFHSLTRLIMSFGQSKMG